MISILGFLIIELTANLKIVKADTCILENEYTSQLQAVLNNQFQANLGNNAWTVNFNTPINFNQEKMDYIKFYLHWSIRQTNNTITNINLQETCSSVIINENFSNPSYTITYADGTQARVNGVEYDAICQRYNTSGSATYNYQPNINMVHLVIIRDDDKYITCDVDKNGIATCPIEGNHNYKAFRYYMTLSEGTNIPISIGIITRNVPKCKTTERMFVEKQEETNNKIDEIQKQDIPSDSKEAPNQDSFNNYENKENQIKEATSNADMSAINVAMDIPTSNWIWETMTKIFNTNPIIMSMIITFLSIGVIKLILRR